MFDVLKPIFSNVFAFLENTYILLSDTSTYHFLSIDCFTLFLGSTTSFPCFRLAAEHAHGAALRGAHGQGQQPLRRQGGQGAAALNANAGTLNVEVQKKNRAQQNLLGFLGIGVFCSLFFDLLGIIGIYEWLAGEVKTETQLGFEHTYNMFETHNQDRYMFITYYNILSIEGKANDFLNRVHYISGPISTYEYELPFKRDICGHLSGMLMWI